MGITFFKMLVLYEGNIVCNKAPCNYTKKVFEQVLKLYSQGSFYFPSFWTTNGTFIFYIIFTINKPWDLRNFYQKWKRVANLEQLLLVLIVNKKIKIGWKLLCSWMSCSWVRFRMWLHQTIIIFKNKFIKLANVNIQYYLLSIKNFIFWSC